MSDTPQDSPIPPEGCICASFWTVRQAHKSDCPLAQDSRAELDKKIKELIGDAYRFGRGEPVKRDRDYSIPDKSIACTAMAIIDAYVAEQVAVKEVELLQWVEDLGIAATEGCSVHNMDEYNRKFGEDVSFKVHCRLLDEAIPKLRKLTTPPDGDKE